MWCECEVWWEWEEWWGRSEPGSIWKNVYKWFVSSSNSLVTNNDRIKVKWRKCDWVTFLTHDFTWQFLHHLQIRSCQQNDFLIHLSTSTIRFLQKSQTMVIKLRHWVRSASIFSRHWEGHQTYSDHDDNIMATHDKTMIIPTHSLIHRHNRILDKIPLKVIFWKSLMINKNLFSPAKSQWCCNLAILIKVTSHHLLLWKIILPCRFDLIITTIHKSAPLGRNLPVIWFNHNNLNAMWQFHESRNLRDLQHPPLSQDHPLVYQRKCNFCIKDWQKSVTEWGLS